MRMPWWGRAQRVSEYDIIDEEEFFVSAEKCHQEDGDLTPVWLNSSRLDQSLSTKADVLVVVVGLSAPIALSPRAVLIAPGGASRHTALWASDRGVALGVECSDIINLLDSVAGSSHHRTPVQPIRAYRLAVVVVAGSANRHQAEHLLARRHRGFGVVRSLRGIAGVGRVAAMRFLRRADLMFQSCRPRSAALSGCECARGHAAFGDFRIVLAIGGCGIVNRNGRARRVIRLGDACYEDTTG
ncbi:hypothetical protein CAUPRSCDRAFT_10751 [Caulochytrium protostelioides]|uniref:Uncharacterized protein n=1 Tax=Caulochytrium protostelioides TaxID=1555241 RepID=A0A4P9X0T0_9FUNG|nr:hypothetical protein CAUPRSCDRAFT_10751 [Caulochytrium protostelioides]